MKNNFVNNEDKTQKDEKEPFNNSWNEANKLIHWKIHENLTMSLMNRISSHCLEFSLICCECGELTINNKFMWSSTV